MFQFPALRAIACAAIFTIPSFAPAQSTTQHTRTPVLVELFTSEGCSSCPPADALLARLIHDQPVSSAEIIVLGEHVDYWDQLGWHDRFSSHQYTERQNQYVSHLNIDSGYTPQMIVDGTEQFVGNDASHALHAITHAAQTSKISLSLSNLSIDGRHVAGTLSTQTVSEPSLKGDLYAALIDPTDTTDVRKGENSGRQLKHVSVVRSLQRIGSLKDLASGPVKFNITAPEISTPASMRVVVFAQRNGPGPVLGAVSTATTQ